MPTQPLLPRHFDVQLPISRRVNYPHYLSLHHQVQIFLVWRLRPTPPLVLTCRALRIPIKACVLFRRQTLTTFLDVRLLLTTLSSVCRKPTIRRVFWRCLAQVAVANPAWCLPD